MEIELGIGKNLEKSPKGKLVREGRAISENVDNLLGYSDYFLAFPAKMPKLAIRDYVWASGVCKVPDALTVSSNIGVKEFEERFPFGVFIRSEGSFEYVAGVSGLMDSYYKEPFYINEIALLGPSGINHYIDSLAIFISLLKHNLKQALSGLEYSLENLSISREQFKELIKRVSAFLNYTKCRGGDIVGKDFFSLSNDEEKVLQIRTINSFLEKLNYSIWQKIDGANISIVEDNCLEGKYFIFVSLNGFTYKIIYLNGEVVEENILGHYWGEQYFPNDAPKELLLSLLERVGDLVDNYEKVRSLDKFDRLQCPIMEFQFGKSKPQEEDDFWFLQYHRTRFKEKPNFKLEESDIKEYIKKGYKKAEFFRGATSSKGEYFYDVEVEAVDVGRTNYNRYLGLGRRGDIKIVDRLSVMDGFHSSLGELTMPQIFIADSSVGELGTKLNLHIVSDGMTCLVKENLKN